MGRACSILNEEAAKEYGEPRSCAHEALLPSTGRSSGERTSPPPAGCLRRSRISASTRLRSEASFIPCLCRGKPRCPSRLWQVDRHRQPRRAAQAGNSALYTPWRPPAWLPHDDEIPLLRGGTQDVGGKTKAPSAASATSPRGLPRASSLDMELLGMSWGIQLEQHGAMLQRRRGQGEPPQPPPGRQGGSRLRTCGDLEQVRAADGKLRQLRVDLVWAFAFSQRLLMSEQRGKKVKTHYTGTLDNNSSSTRRSPKRAISSPWPAR